MSIALLAATLLLQDAHAHHAPPPKKEEADAHAHHAAPPPPEAQTADPHAHHAAEPAKDAADQNAMDHSQMDHSAMGHAMPAATDKLAGIPMTPPPREAGEGPANAARAIYGAAAMDRARAALIHETGEQRFFWFQTDRLETRIGGDSLGFLWDAQASYGGDLDKLWIESEGEGDVDEGVEGADVEATWSRAIAPFWDLQLGARQDLAGSSRTYATIGVQGLAPYLFEVDAGAYLSTEGELTAKIEAELDQRVTQRLVLQPRAELLLSAQDIPDLGLGAGVSGVEAGLRLRYEFSREFAPYIGIAHERRIGASPRLTRALGDDTEATRLVAGLRFWF